MQVTLAPEVPRVWTPQDVYLGALRSLLFVAEEPPGSNAGQAVEAFLAVCGHKPGQPWCMAVLSYVGRQCFGRSWPLRMTAGTNDAADQAREKGIRFLPSEAEPGDIVLLWSTSLKRFRHAFVLEALQEDGQRWDTLEGNTNRAGSREGTAFLRRDGAIGRVLQPGDRLIKWHRGLA
jgi:hypothetical protein